MNKIFLFPLLTLIMIGCYSDNDQVISRNGFAVDDRKYKLDCIDKTINDTVISIAINLETNSAQIELSRRVSIGVSLTFNNSGSVKLYSMNFFRLKAPLGYHSSIQMDSSTVFFPVKMKNSIEENLVNISLQFVETKAGIVFTDELSGAEALRKTLIDFHYLKELDGHRLIITESFQDSQKNEIITIFQDN